MGEIKKVTHKFTRINNGQFQDKITRNDGYKDTIVYPVQCIDAMFEDTLKLLIRDNVKRLTIRAEIETE